MTIAERESVASPESFGQKLIALSVLRFSKFIGYKIYELGRL